MLDVRDDTFPAAGMAGLWTKADASSSFDDVAVKAVRATKEDREVESKMGHDEDEDEDDDDDHGGELFE